jgi:hypothetical protein
MQPSEGNRRFKGVNMKRLRALLCSVLLLAASVLSVMPAAQTAEALGANIVANPSMETSVSGKPTGWSTDKYGTNAATFTYSSTGHTGSHSLNTKMTSHTSGDAKWFFTPVTVTPSTSYTFSDWYLGTKVTSVDAMVTLSTGKTSDIWLGDPAASTTWKQATYTFTRHQGNDLSLDQQGWRADCRRLQSGNYERHYAFADTDADAHPNAFTHTFPDSDSEPNP